MTVSRQMVAPALGVIASCLLLLATGGLDQGVPGDRLGPAFWPRLVLACLAGTCLVRLAGSLRGRPTTAAAGADGVVPEATRVLPDATVAVDMAPAPIALARLGVAMTLILLYVLATPITGFPLATMGFVAGFMWVSGARSAAGIAVGAVLGTVGLLYLFVKAVYLPLPKGDGPFEAVTLALYRVLRIF
jgi:putative tricarboxylic transport membrane protein